MVWGARNSISTQVEMAPTTTSVKTCANVSDGCHASITSGTLDDLRTAVKHACGRSDVVLAASYSRKTLGQTGDGHFSPVARRRPANLGVPSRRRWRAAAMACCVDGVLVA